MQFTFNTTGPEASFELIADGGYELDADFERGFAPHPSVSGGAEKRRGLAAAGCRVNLEMEVTAIGESLKSKPK